MSVAGRDQNDVPTLLGVSNVDGSTPITVYVDPSTHRLLVDLAGGSGTVTTVSVVSANGFAGTVANATTTPAITLTTTVTGIIKGNGTAMSAATAGVDYTALAFKTITVAGQSDIVADSAADTLTVVGAGTITVTTNASTDTITFTGASGADNITVGVTTITSGTTTRILYDNAGTLGEYTITGTGTVVAMQTAPVFVTSITTPAVLATANDSGALGASGTAFADLFLASGGVINWAAADVTITHSTNTLAFGGAASGYTFDALVTPSANDAAPLGAATVSWSDLFLASGALLNFANGNAVITHSSGILTQTTGELRITSANVGTNADSVPTLSSTSTLTNKTLTSPVLTSPTINTAPVFGDAANIKLTVPSGDLTATGLITNQFNSGYTSTAIGDLVYLDSSATWQKAKADSVTTSTNMLGIALSVTASGAAATVLLQGFVYAASPFPTFTIGTPIYISGATAGIVTQTAPSTTDFVIRIVGYGIHADKMWFNPSNDWITHV